MRSWLLNSAAVFAALALMSAGCTHRMSKEKNTGATPPTDTIAQRDVPAAGTPANASETNLKTGGDSLGYKGEVRHGGPDQRKIDSIKEEKTKRKK